MVKEHKMIFNQIVLLTKNPKWLEDEEVSRKVRNCAKLLEFKKTPESKPVKGKVNIKVYFPDGREGVFASFAELSRIEHITKETVKKHAINKTKDQFGRCYEFVKVKELETVG